MMNKTLGVICIVAMTLITACNNRSVEQTASNETAIDQSNDSTKNAIIFINDYIYYFNQPDQFYASQWMLSNSYTTNDFKVEYDKIIKQKQEGKTNLLDPIFNTPKLPIGEFEFDSFDSKNLMVIARNKSNKAFKVHIYIKKDRGQYMIDGCGIVNVSPEKQQIR